MKMLKNEQEYSFEDLKDVRCSVCSAGMYDVGLLLNKSPRIKCIKCGTIYSFEPTRWKIFLDEKH